LIPTGEITARSCCDLLYVVDRTVGMRPRLPLIFVSRCLSEVHGWPSQDRGHAEIAGGVRSAFTIAFRTNFLRPPGD
jgi:hypothetical protein